LADIAADGRRAGEVIQRLRALLRKGPLELKPLDLNELVEQTTRLVGSDLLLRAASLDLELAQGLPQVAGDRVHLQQVLLNLVLNALDAMADCPVEARRIALRTSPRENGRVLVEVRDAGVGIAGEAASLLFEPFFTTKSDGMGMGLSIVRSIVESHGGRVWAANNAGPGATFTIELPGADAMGEVA
jgi:two-component system sensor kinase FixL